MPRTPKDYQGTGSTLKEMGQLLPQLLREIGENYQERPDLILAAWAGVIGERLAPMTEAVSFVRGVLTVKIKNSTLHSLLYGHEKQRLLKSLQDKFPSVKIRNIIFRIG